MLKTTACDDDLDALVNLLVHLIALCQLQQDVSQRIYIFDVELEVQLLPITPGSTQSAIPSSRRALGWPRTSHSSQERFEANVHQICSALQAKRSTGVSLYV